MKDLEAHLDEWLKLNELSEDVQLRRFRIYGKAEADPGQQGGAGAYPSITIDDATIRTRFDLAGQGWHSDTDPRSGNYMQGCFWTGGGDGSRTAVWGTDNPMVGKYKVYVYYGHPPVGTLATNAPFTPLRSMPNLRQW